MKIMTELAARGVGNRKETSKKGIVWQMYHVGRAIQMHILL